jgi:hypothetical protein
MVVAQEPSSVTVHETTEVPAFTMLCQKQCQPMEVEVGKRFFFWKCLQFFMNRKKKEKKRGKGGKMENERELRHSLE